MGKEEFYRLKSESEHPTHRARHSPVNISLKWKQWAIDEGIVDLSGEPIVVDNAGMVILYHRTTQEAKDRIYATGNFESKENTNETFFSNRKNGQARGYGQAIVTVRIPVKDVRANDAFRHEIHVAVPNRLLSKKSLINPAYY
jgi:hypothetical protein